MGNLSDAMQNVVNEINAAAERRKAALSDLCSQAGKQRREVASDIKQAGRIWRGQENLKKRKS